VACTTYVGPPPARNLVDFAQKSSAPRYMALLLQYPNSIGPRYLLGIEFCTSEDCYVVYGNESSCWHVMKRHICPVNISVFIPHPQEG
jgi:hypothetical protein